MLLPILLVADLHLTANPEHEYRWRLFDFLEDQCHAEQVKTLVILGDLTDAKDYHPASLTNRVVEQIMRLRKVVPEIFILQGNHDYLKAGESYFDFLSYLPGVYFASELTLSELDDGPAVAMLPHTKNPAKDWAGLDLSHYNYVFIHQTISGAVASNGQVMEGEQLPDLSTWGKIYSGDIHVPQVIGPVEYVGSPYHVHFGDRFRPRAVLLDRRNRPVDLHHDNISRVAVTVRGMDDLREMDWRSGDHAKITVLVDPADVHDWKVIRRNIAAYLEEAKVLVHDIKLRVVDTGARLEDAAPRRGAVLSDDQLVERWVRNEDLGGDALDMGLEFIK